MIKMNTQALDRIKAQIFSLKGNTVELCINRGRKKFETIECIISSAYPSVFTVECDNKVQTFSYFDVLCGTVTFTETKTL